MEKALEKALKEFQTTTRIQAEQKKGVNFFAHQHAEDHQ
jgi:hypothetical protein